jgi:hypothetical protein
MGNIYPSSEQRQVDLRQLDGKTREKVGRWREGEDRIKEWGECREGPGEVSRSLGKPNTSTLLTSPNTSLLLLLPATRPGIENAAST